MDMVCTLSQFEVELKFIITYFAQVILESYMGMLPYESDRDEGNNLVNKLYMLRFCHGLL